MRTLAGGMILLFAMNATAFAKDDHHECEEALDRLDSANQQEFTKNSHHEHQQAKEAKKSGDFKKCADQANKAIAHMKKT